MRAKRLVTGALAGVTTLTVDALFDGTWVSINRKEITVPTLPA